MAELIWLEHGEQPPTNARWVFVDQKSRGITWSQDQVFGPPGFDKAEGLSSATFYVVEPFREAQWVDAIQKAIRHADDERIARVYVSARVPAALRKRGAGNPT